MMQRPMVWLLCFMEAFCFASPAWATLENLKSFKEAYPVKSVTCKTCHESAIGKKGDLNA